MYSLSGGRPHDCPKTERRMKSDFNEAIRTLSEVVQNRPKPIREFDQIFMRNEDMVKQASQMSGMEWRQQARFFNSPGREIQDRRRKARLQSRRPAKAQFFPVESVAFPSGAYARRSAIPELCDPERPKMPAFVTFGRILFAVLFVFSGASKLLDLSATAQMTEKIVLPAIVAPYTAQLETITGMPMAQLLAIAAGGIEVICGLMIALNLGARFFAIVLILFVAGATFYYHDFWNQTGADARNNLVHALKNLSIIGALFMIVGTSRFAKSQEPAYDV